MESYPKVTIDLTKNPTVTWTATHNQSGANISLLSVRNKAYSDFMSLSLNYSILDGTLSQELTNIAYASNVISDYRCEISGCTITGTFAEPQDFVATTLNFGKNFPKKIYIEYFDSNSSLITYETIDNIDSEIILTNRSVTNCRQMRLTFQEMWEPLYICCLQEWTVGALLEYGQKNLISLRLNETRDPITRELPISTLQMNAYPILGNFDIRDPNGAIKYLKPGVVATLSTTIVMDDETFSINFGKWYIRKVETDDNSTLKIMFEDLIGRLNDFKFSKSLLYGALDITDSRRWARSVIQSIVSEALVECEFDDGAIGGMVFGYLPYTSCRDALKQICFENRFIVQTKDKIRISQYSDNKAALDIISSSNITEPPKFELLDLTKTVTVPYVNGVSLESNTSDLATDINHSATYAHEPATDVSLVRVSGDGTALLFENNLTNAYVIFLNSQGTFKLVGRKYVPTGGQNQLTMEDQNASGTLKVNITASTSVTSVNAYSIAHNTIGFLNRNILKTTFEYINTGQRAGSKVQIDLPGKQMVGWITHQSIDLVNGMLTQIEILGEQNVLLANSDN